MLNAKEEMHNFSCRSERDITHKLLCLPESDHPVLNEVSLERMKNESAYLPVDRRVFGEVSAPFQANYTMRHNI